MTNGRFSLPALFTLLMFFHFANNSYSVNVSGGIDTRFTYESPDEGSSLKLEGLFLNLRKVWSDELGDRWILVGQVDFDDNFDRIRPYQAYLQYKGPLGKWNVRGGHFILPFGLLASYDTERLLLTGLESETLGIRKDTGGEILGHFGNWDYAASVTTGLSDHHLMNFRANPVLTARVAYVQTDWQIGFSIFRGTVFLEDSQRDPDTVAERRFAVDTMSSFGPLTIRAEVTVGTNEARIAGGGNVLIDYALKDRLEINMQYGNWYEAANRNFMGLGFTWHLGSGFIARAADIYMTGEGANTFAIQLYYQFSKNF